MTKDFNFNLPEELHNKVKEIAKKEFRSMADIMRQAIKFYIDGSKEGKDIK